MSFVSEKNSWKSMMRRCFNPKDPSYKYVGARGFTVCERWRSFDLFIEDMGPKPGTGFSIDRIDNDQGYFPGNCRWATPKEQSRNRTTYNRLIEFHGDSRCIPEWAELFGLRKTTISCRIYRLGWPIEKALTTQPYKAVRAIKPFVAEQNAKNGSSGFKGVAWHKPRKKWQARHRVGQKIVYLGYFANKEDAIQAVKNAAAAS